MRYLRLSTREVRLLELIASGQTTEQMALAMHLSPRTVAHLVSEILQRYELCNRAQLVALGFISGMLDPRLWPPQRRKLANGESTDAA